MRNLRFWVAVPVLFIFGPSSMAQIGTLIKGIDEVEIMAGPGLVSLRGITHPEYNETKVGYTAGIGASWYLSNKTALSTKLLLERKGNRRSYEVTYFDELSQEFKGQIEEIRILDYLSVPVTFRFFFDKRKYFFVEAGPYGSYLHKAQSITNLSWRGKDINNRKDSYTEFDAGIFVGAGYRPPLSRSLSAGFLISSAYGFTDISLASSNSAYHLSKNEMFTIAFSLIKKLNTQDINPAEKR